ncbi:MAG: hypothetical protein E3J56_08095 [Candidatus Aminicenantes bacterium]|nr:MAG: hypothetical protein E3J56_08095 [Candidatus Aminicenantes bacterium]
MKKIIYLLLGLSLSCFLVLVLGTNNSENKIVQEEDLTKKEEKIKKLEAVIKDMENKIEQLEKKIAELRNKLECLKEKPGMKMDYKMEIFTQKHNGKEFKIHIGETFQVILPENPTTGYIWTVYKPGTPNISLVSKSFSSPQEEPPAVGRGGTRIFTFRASEVGLAELHLRLRRPWEEESKFSDSFHIKLKIIDQ